MRIKPSTITSKGGIAAWETLNQEEIRYRDLLNAASEALDYNLVGKNYSKWLNILRLLTILKDGEGNLTFIHQELARSAEMHDVLGMVLKRIG